MHIQNLTKGWQYAMGPALKDATIKDMPEDGWRDITVPGDINVALQKDGVVGNAHYDDNAKELYFVSANEWWYRLKFDIDQTCQGMMNMVFETLDGTCDIFLNGEKLYRAQSAFYAHNISVRSKLFLTGNELVVRFLSVDRLLQTSRYNGQTGWGWRRGFLRKPQYTFGWDWALPVPSLGICGPVRIEYDCSNRIEDVDVDAHTNGRVDLMVTVHEYTLENDFTLEFEVWGHGYSEKKTIDSRRIKTGTYFQIDDPKLWWPAGYGEQNLYNYKVSIYAEGKLCDTKEGKFGLRDVEILEEPFTEEAGYGYSWWILVNGVRIFCKGANHIPLELWPAYETNEKIEWCVKKAKEANFNMLRIWGGGIYCRDCFYEACDREGIMVWQDFMFASSAYPVSILRDLIIKEVNYQILRLRTHPSIVLWCGCNEDTFSWADKSGNAAAAVQNDVQAADEIPEGLWRVDRDRYDPELYTMIIRGLVSKLCHGTPYVESSPQARDGEGNQANSGNAHISCWKYALFEKDDFRNHFKNVCSFDSEFCIQGPCSEKYLRSFMRQENHWPPNDNWTYHVQRGHYNLPHHVQTMEIAGGLFGEIDTLQKYTKYGQATHIEMMRSEFESARHDYPNNGGTMMWMYIDCWPTSNWAIIDYDRHMKPSYYAAKRGCAPVLPIVFERNGKIDLSISNHTMDDCEVNLKYGICRLNGDIITEKSAKVYVDACTNNIFDFILRENTTFADDEYIFIDAEGFDCVSYFPNGWKNVPFEKADVVLDFGEIKNVDGIFTASITVKASNFVRLAHFDLPDGAEIDDNYFDLPKGKEKTVTIKSKCKFEQNDIKFGDWFSDWE